jgi:CTP synthase (UTP-ammonia lyase)
VWVLPFTNVNPRPRIAFDRPPPRRLSFGVLQIAIVADYQPDLPSHDATDAAIRHAARALQINYSTEWIPTDALEENPEHRLRFSRGFLIGTGSPYFSIKGALNAIRVARQSGRPLLGTCGGFQHIALEYARNVAGIAEAQHAEYEDAPSPPDAKASQKSAKPSRTILIRALPCSLAGKTLHVDLAPGSLARKIYGRDQIEETYHCNYGLDPAYRQQLEAAGLRVTGVEAANSEANSESGSNSGTESVGEPRILELPTHPFFIGTLFVPQMRSTPQQPHPLFEAFLRATIESRVPVEERPTFDDEVGIDE